VDGGLWKTNNITVNPAVWTPINDYFGNLSVASICQDPTNFNIMYFATGEKAINADAVRGAGIWQSTDHGVNWTVMSGTQNFTNVSKIICDANGNLYVANNLSGEGLRRFNKSAGTWANITPAGLTTNITDIELSSTGRLHVACGYNSAPNSGYRYTASPATVTPTTWTAPVTTFPTAFNSDIASNGNTLYALSANAAYQVPIIYRSTNGGANWTATGATPAFTSGFAWYCLAICVNPNNANNVIVGSLDCFGTTNGGNSWNRVSNWVGTTGQYVHADQHIISWNTNNQVLIGCDGGIHYSANGGTTITDRNVGLRIKQFYSVAVHPTATNYFIGGTQDNGVHQLNNPGIGASVEVTGGDGSFVHIDQDQPQFQWGSYIYNRYRRSTNGGSAWTVVDFSTAEVGRFINPTDYDDVNNFMYCAGNANSYIRWNNPQTGNTFNAITMNQLNGGMVSAIKVSPYSNNTVYFGGQTSLIRAVNANTATPVFTSIISTAMQNSGGYISSIEFGSNEQNIIVTMANYGINNVWETNNGGATWTAIDGNLPDMPVRWALFYPDDQSKAIIATETGVWQTEFINGAATVWDPETGFPNVRTDMLQIRLGDRLLAAATHGRGIYTTNLPVSCPIPVGLTTTNITENSAVLNWNAIAGANSYTVEYKVTSATQWTSLAVGTTAISVNLSGLLGSTSYTWRVRSNCTNGNSIFSSVQFTTTTANPCIAPTGLTTTNIQTNSAVLNWQPVSWLPITEVVTYTVEYQPNGAPSWTIANTGLTTTSTTLASLAAGTTFNWRVRAMCNATFSSVYSAISSFATLPTPCNTPTGLNATNITVSSATVNWAAVTGAVNYTVEYKPSAATTWTTAASATTATSLSITGLAANANYDWRVRTNCSGSSSGFAASAFTTLAAPCNTPTGLNTTNLTTSSATVNWGVVSGALNYTVEYKLSAATTWTTAASATTATSVNITGLAANATYDWRVRTNCSGSSSSFATSSFTTLMPPCNAPTGLNTSGITSTIATLGWNAASGAVSYSVDYKTAASTTWINIASATTATSVNLSGLIPSTIYDWRVRTNCAATNSIYTTAQFTTLAPPCTRPTGLVTNSEQPTFATVSWQPVSGAQSYTVEYKLTSASTFTVAFSATTSTTVTITGLNPSSNYDWQVKTNCAGGVSSPYSFWGGITTPPLCLSNFEPNESLPASTGIPNNTNLQAGINSSGDTDWFTFNLAAASNINISLTTLPANFDMVVYNPSQTEIGRSQNTGLSSESVILNNLPAGDYYIQVFGAGGASNTTGCYTINAGVTSAVSNCGTTYDGGNNDFFGGAAFIPMNVDINGLIYPTGDIDYYTFSLSSFSDINVQLFSLPADYDLRLYNGSGGQLGASLASGTSPESIFYSSAPPGTYYVEVSSGTLASTPLSCYSLNVTSGILFRKSDKLPATANRPIQLLVQPNPVKANLNVVLPGLTGKIAIRVYDRFGTEVWRQNTTQASSWINTSGWASGVYMIKVEDETGIIRLSGKFVKE
jgi:hypothetical protein